MFIGQDPGRLHSPPMLLRSMAIVAISCSGPSVLAAHSEQENVVQAFINAGVSAGHREITIPPGRYKVVPKDGVHLSLIGLSDRVINATGVEIICSETTLAVEILHCNRITLKGLTIDYDPLPFTQGRITAISSDRNSHIVALDAGFPDAAAAYSFKHAIYTAGRELRFGNYYQFQVEALSSRTLRVFGLSEQVDGGEQEGDIVVVSAQTLSGRYRPHAVQIEDSIGTSLVGVTIYSSPCFGFFEIGSTDSVYRDCVIDRRDGRVHSLNADAFHSKYAKVGPQIINCKAMWQGDDCVNICGDFHLVTGSDKDSLRVLGSLPLRIHAGDPLQLATVTGMRLPNAKVIEVTYLGPSSPADELIVDSAPLRHEKARRMNQAFRLRLDRPVSLPNGSVVASENAQGNGFTVRDCLFGNNRSRGILIKASRGEVSGNTLVNTHMAAIKIAPEYYWLESGFSHDLVVRKNHILHPRREAIQIVGIGEFPGHRNITLLDNFILTEFRPAVRFECVEKGMISGLEVMRSDGSRMVDALQVLHSPGLITP